MSRASPCVVTKIRMTSLHEILTEASRTITSVLTVKSIQVSDIARQDRDLPIIFTMARLDTVKNLTGLVELYATSDRLRKARWLPPP